jgi:hypothetical protein
MEERDKRYKAILKGGSPNWSIKKKVNASSLDPAGSRIPKDFKRR